MPMNRKKDHKTSRVLSTYMYVRSKNEKFGSHIFKFTMASVANTRFFALVSCLVVVVLHPPLSAAAGPASQWNCTLLGNTTLGPNVWWSQHNCEGMVPKEIGHGKLICFGGW